MKKFLSAKPVRIGLVILTAGLVLGLALPGVVAAKEARIPPDLASPNTLKGKVTVIATDKTSFNIQTASGETVTIKVDSNTKYYEVMLPINTAAIDKLRERLQDRLEKAIKNHSNNERGKGNKNGQANSQAYLNEDEDEQAEALSEEDNAQVMVEQLKAGLPAIWRQNRAATFNDLAVGETVVVRVMPNENLAKQVVIVKQSGISKVHGTITAVGASSITITRSDNTSITLSWDGNTRFILKGVISVQNGEIATAVYNSETKLAKLVSVALPQPTPALSPTPAVST